MRAIDRNLLVFSTASMLFFGIFTVRNMITIKEAVSLHENAEAESVEQVEEKIDPWDLFVEAVIWRESRGDSNAIGDNGKAVGVLQIHPIMVREANRILAMNGKENSYTYDDRYSREKSIEMFKIVQDFHNKSHDFDKALRIWNKNHPSSYKNDIMNKYNEYLNGEQTTKDAVSGRV